ncbi:DUF1223 domain-containing protein [Mucilaginibacter jinjuensis]|uniref:DUF1223 domain-containing protein n=1 Tax=Mucilaginibacter jinjuensis TaxID=1176721 RepID=A0ABY7T2C7_9SPHI|nr:DUF1223 domain-containing protein [Mucilaginibacter jinjuensis]WCT10589.1 DUF1223 domain-containing protein [Mucilaginibacter jinjuensis]
MKILKIAILVVFLVSAGMISKAITGHIHKVHSNLGDKGFAVVELFTSEGCSSCPPADELVSRIQKESAGQPIYILAYHVDYWNRLGWKDVFSNAEYSKRQGQYSEWLKSGSVYTPQIVVNGKKEFIGSEENTLRNAIKNSLQNSSPNTLNFSNIKLANNNVALQYHTQATSNNTSLVLALVEKAARSQVKSGENSGRTLSHVQIVRGLQNININGKADGNSSIIIPQGLNTKDLELIGFLQNESNGEILAASRTELNAINQLP